MIILSHNGTPADDVETAEQAHGGWVDVWTRNRLL